MSIVINGERIIDNVKIIEPVYSEQRLLGQIVAYKITKRSGETFVISSDDLKNIKIN